MRRTLLTIGVALGIAICVGVLSGTRSAAQTTGAAIAIDGDDLAGTVTGPRGPEAGVWVIAETSDLPTKFAKIVVTDDQGRYLMPDLPTANYDVWVRGYGLVDSPKVKATPGKTLEPHRGRRAQCQGGRAVLPGRLLVVAHPACRTRANSRAPGRGQRHRAEHEEPGGVDRQMQVARLHRSAISSAARGRARFRRRSGTFPTSVAAWERRVQSGRPAAQMSGGAEQFGQRARAGDVRRLDRPHRARAKCRRRRRVRRASSGTSSSRSGIWPTRRSICTTSCPPIGAIRASTPTGRSTARWS